MTQENTTAFDHPEARAQATAPDGVWDRISLRDHVVSVEIGAFQAERGITQRLSFDIVVEVAAHNGAEDDDVDAILSYDRLTWAIDHELGLERLNLLETLAERIADRVLMEPQAKRVFLRIQKLDKGNGALGVEIVRVPGQVSAETEIDVRPFVVFLSNEALLSEHLENWVGQLKRSEHPVVISLDVPTVVMHAGHSVAQRHIDLLSIEQSAWWLAAQFDGLSVAGTKTELHWSLKNGHSIVWAPSKLVLDATEEVPKDPVEMAAWFAETWNAVKFVSIGKDVPVSNTIPTQIVTVDQSQI